MKYIIPFSSPGEADSTFTSSQERTTSARRPTPAQRQAWNAAVVSALCPAARRTWSVCSARPWWLAAASHLRCRRRSVRILSALVALGNQSAETVETILGCRAMRAMRMLVRNTCCMLSFAYNIRHARWSSMGSRQWDQGTRKVISQLVMVTIWTNIDDRKTESNQLMKRLEIKPGKGGTPMVFMVHRKIISNRMGSTGTCSKVLQQHVLQQLRLLGRRVHPQKADLRRLH